MERSEEGVEIDSKNWLDMIKQHVILSLVTQIL